jgi:flagellar protein FlaG
MICKAQFTGGSQMLIETIKLSTPSPNPLSPVGSQTESQPSQVPKGVDEKRENPADSPTMSELAMDLQRQLKMLHNIDLRFSVHEPSGEVMVTVIDEESGRVLREIPHSEILDLATKLEEAIGLIFDTKA